MLIGYCTLSSRTSGLGDHGPKGIQDFITSHTCNHICQALELESSQVLQDTLDDLLQDLGGAHGETDGSASRGPFHMFAPSEEE